MEALKKVAIGFGAALTLVGIMGFIGLFTSAANGHEKLLGLFEVDTLHNIIHLASGLVCLAASRNVATSQLFFKVFSFVYGLVTLLGFIQGHTVLGPIDINPADNLLHIAITLFALYFGFAFKTSVEG